MEEGQQSRRRALLQEVQAPRYTRSSLDGVAVTRTTMMGISFGVVLLALWLRRQGKFGLLGLLILTIGYMVAVQLMRAAGCFHD
jgi:hypothetical protein